MHAQNGGRSGDPLRPPGISDAAQPPPVENDPKEQRRVVDAFLAASRAGDLAMLLQVLDSDVIFRADMGVGPRVPAMITGSSAVAKQVITGGTPLAALAKPVLVNGSAGVVVGDLETPIAVASFVVRHGRILEIDLIADPEKIRPTSG